MWDLNRASGWHSSNHTCSCVSGKVSKCKAAAVAAAIFAIPQSSQSCMLEKKGQRMYLKYKLKTNGISNTSERCSYSKFGFAVLDLKTYTLALVG